MSSVKEWNAAVVSVVSAAVSVRCGAGDSGSSGGGGAVVGGPCRHSSARRSLHLFSAVWGNH